jgi:hypothetical protein
MEIENLLQLNEFDYNEFIINTFHKYYKLYFFKIYPEM